jgi:hypothetical protein
VEAQEHVYKKEREMYLPISLSKFAIFVNIDCQLKIILPTPVTLMLHLALY